MIYLRKPKTEQVRGWLDEQSGRQVTCRDPVGDAETALQDGFHLINFSQSLGRGEEIFHAAISALNEWRCFSLSWTNVNFDGMPKIGCHLAVTARVCRLWSVNCCRVVDYDPCDSDPDVWSFSIGTLPRHMVSGQERISVSIDRHSGQVTYHICSFSRPNTWISRMSVPIMRRYQMRFCSDSFASMQRFIRALDRTPKVRPSAATV